MYVPFLPELNSKTLIGCTRDANIDLARKQKIGVKLFGSKLTNM